VTPVNRLFQGPDVELAGPTKVVEGPWAVLKGPAVSFLLVSLKTGAVAVRCTETFCVVMPVIGGDSDLARCDDE